MYAGNCPPDHDVSPNHTTFLFLPNVIWQGAGNQRIIFFYVRKTVESLSFIIVNRQFRFSVVTNCRGLTCMNVSYVLGHERESSFFQNMSCILCVLIIFWCWWVKYNTLLKEYGLRLTVCACYSSEVAFSIGLDTSFGRTGKEQGESSGS
jgi:hypothetical protein